MEPKGFMCMGIAKGLLIHSIRKYGLEGILNVPEGTTVEQAVEMIQDDPREVFTPCTNVDEKGYCKGHAKGRKDREDG